MVNGCVWLVGCFVSSWAIKPMCAYVHRDENDGETIFKRHGFRFSSYVVGLAKMRIISQFPPWEFLGRVFLVRGCTCLVIKRIIDRLAKWWLKMYRNYMTVPIRSLRLDLATRKSGISHSFSAWRQSCTCQTNQLVMRMRNAKQTLPSSWCLIENFNLALFSIK